MQPELYPSLSHAVTTACIQKHNGTDGEKEADRVGVLAVADRKTRVHSFFRSRSSMPGRGSNSFRHHQQCRHPITTSRLSSHEAPFLALQKSVRIDQTAAHWTKEIPRFSVPLWSPCPILPNRKRRETQRNIKEKWVAPVVYMYCKSEQNAKKDDRAQHEGTKSSLSQHRAIRDLSGNFWFKHMSQPARM